MSEWWHNTSRWLLGQMLWSKARLFTVLGVLVVGLVWLMIPPNVPFFVTADQAPAPTQDAAAPGAVSAPSPATALSPSPSPGTGFGILGEDITAQEASANAFLAVYLNPPSTGEGRQGWVDDLGPVTGGVLLAGLEVARLEEIPTGDAGDLDWVTVGDTYAEANVAVDGGLLLRIVVKADPAGVWRVYDVRPVPTEGV